ncbi:hypothetical protein [Sphingomonas sp.]|uniref:hypothetical protein n=1 Tax=Sphingomonas sp. TaxID=28214 RepID=UPI003BAC3B0E
MTGATILEPSRDGERINALVNHPAIRPHVGGDVARPLDLSAAVADCDNFFLLGEHGGFACCWSAPSVFEVHTFILPEGRGPWAAQAAADGIALMAQHGARHLWTRVAPDAENVRSYTLRAGFTPAGVRTLDLGAGPVTYQLYERRLDQCQQQ